MIKRCAPVCTRFPVVATAPFADRCRSDRLRPWQCSHWNHVSAFLPRSLTGSHCMGVHSWQSAQNASGSLRFGWRRGRISEPIGSDNVCAFARSILVLDGDHVVLFAAFFIVCHRLYGRLDFIFHIVQFRFPNFPVSKNEAENRVLAVRSGDSGAMSQHAYYQQFSDFPIFRYALYVTV